MKIDEIENGIVFDHIAAGKGMEVYNALRLDKLKCQVAIIQNAKSEKMGAKDIIKINELIDINLDVLCYIDKNITVNVIKNGKSVEKNLSASEMNKRRLEYARQLDAERYKDERTVPLSELDKQDKQ